MKKISFFLISLILMGCTVTDLSDQNPSKELLFLAKHQWKLLTLHGETPEKNTATMSFDAQKRKVSGNSSCNTYFGAVKLDANKIAFSEVGSTQMACLDKHIEQEFFALLALKNLTFDIADQTFNLYHEDKLVAIFGINR